MSPLARRLPPFLFTSRTRRIHHFLCCSRWLQNRCKSTTNHHRRSKSLPHCTLFAGLAFQCQKLNRKRRRRRFPLDKMRRVASRSYLNHGVFRRKHFCCLKFFSKSTPLFDPDCTEWTVHMPNAWFHVQQQTSRSLFWRFPSHVKSLKSNVLHLALNWMWRHTNFLFKSASFSKRTLGTRLLLTVAQYSAAIKIFRTNLTIIPWARVGYEMVNSQWGP